MKYLLTVAYDGSAYCGYQVQGELPTIQKALCDAACKVLGKHCSVTGCSRTDSGVHARDFKATAEAGDDANSIPIEKLPLALNSVLPSDISVLGAELRDDGFHVRYDVKCKEYEYLIYNSRIRDPFRANREYMYPTPLNDAEMARAAEHFIGTHDFSAFMSAGSDITDRVRTVYSLSVLRNGDTVSVKICANGFLYNMVRIIVGTLIEVSAGKIDADDIPRIINSCDRSLSGFTAPAHALYLNRVEY